MKFLYYRFKSFIHSVTASIAFYPTMYAILSILFAFFMKWAESAGITDMVKSYLPSLIVNDIDTARNILTTIIAGGISILVFSFSMVMLLLSQATTNYSPRVLPSLISNKTHQFILGAFISSIIYNVITIIGIDPNGNDYQIPSVSVLLGVISALIALGAFVFFIHSISTSIQVNNILINIHARAKTNLLESIKMDDSSIPFPDTSDWITYKSNKTGTLQNVSISGLSEFCKENDVQIDLLIEKGEFSLLQSNIFKASKKLKENQLNNIFKNFYYQESEIVRDNYLLGLKQIAEIGIKAMSPGINDPGTAINTVNYLKDLFAHRMQKMDHTLVASDDKVFLRLKSTSFDHLLHNILSSYRNYCKHDFIVMGKLIEMLVDLSNQEHVDSNYLKSIKSQMQLLEEDSKNNIENQKDLEILISKIEKYNF